MALPHSLRRATRRGDVAQAAVERGEAREVGGGEGAVVVVGVVVLVVGSRRVRESLFSCLVEPAQVEELLIRPPMGARARGTFARHSTTHLMISSKRSSGRSERVGGGAPAGASDGEADIVLPLSRLDLGRPALAFPRALSLSVNLFVWEMNEVTWQCMRTRSSWFCKRV